jgi:hypothetical protein
MTEEDGVHHDLQSSVDHKGSFDEEERTIHHVPSLDDIKGSFQAEKATTENPPIGQPGPEFLEDVYPDGGLRAWLVIFGVRYLNPPPQFLLISACRRCVTRSRPSDS